MHIYLNVWKQMIDAEQLLLHSNSWNHLKVPIENELRPV